MISALLQKIKRKLFPPCKHEGAFDKRWLSRDGTPMAMFSCPKCGFSDYGPVYADPDKWV